MADFINNLPPSLREALTQQQANETPDYIREKIARMMGTEAPVAEDEFTKTRKAKDDRPLMADINQILKVDVENLMPFNDKMSRGECYGKGMYDLAVTVRNMTNKAKSARQSQSYMHWGRILDDLICDLEHLTHGIMIQKIQK